MKNKSLNQEAKNSSDDEIKIGDQIWMVKNLDVSIFRNGDIIIEAKTDEEWEKAGTELKPVWCYASKDKKYGKLYNWYAINDQRGLAPVGWHIPNDKEWTLLTEFLGGENKAGSKMKSINGWHADGNGNNKSGFNGLPGGNCDCFGTICWLEYYGFWWTLSEVDENESWNRNLGSSHGSITKSKNDKKDGLSVRCVKD